MIEGIQLFVKYFFTCKECSENFARETHDYASNLEKPNDAVIYLWKGIKYDDKITRILSLLLVFLVLFKDTKKLFSISLNSK